MEYLPKLFKMHSFVTLAQKTLLYVMKMCVCVCVCVYGPSFVTLLINRPSFVTKQ